jgi:MazG family protein
MSNFSRDLAGLEALVARLRGPDGCPWDREQNFEDIRAYLLEEAHEVAAALDGEDWTGLHQELGDLLFQLAFLGQLSREQGRGGLEESIASVQRKMIERHPHVFGDETASDRQEVAQAWERRKLRAQGEDASLLEGMSDTLPSLLSAYRMTQKVAGVGFDWPSVEDVWHKVEEELAEARQALAEGRDRLREEIGDLLFTVANLARWLEIDPEAALARANLKFRNRFDAMEQMLRGRGRPLEEATLDELEECWQAVKERENDA